MSWNRYLYNLQKRAAARFDRQIKNAPAVPPAKINMADKIINLKIDLTKIDKTKLYVGEKGTYLDCTLLYNEATDTYGNNGMIVQQTTKEERAAGKKGNILGNGKVAVFASAPVDPAVTDWPTKQSAAQPAASAVDDLPF